MRPLVLSFFGVAEASDPLELLEGKQGYVLESDNSGKALVSVEGAQYSAIILDEIALAQDTRIVVCGVGWYFSGYLGYLKH